MKKTGSNFHRILKEEIIKFLNESEDSSDAELKEKYKSYLDDPIYAAYVGTSAPAALASTTPAVVAAPEPTADATADSDGDDATADDATADSDGDDATADSDGDDATADDADATPAPPPTMGAFLNAPPAVQSRAQDVPDSSIQRSPTRGGDSASEPEPAPDTEPAAEEEEEVVVVNEPVLDAESNAPEVISSPITIKVDDTPKKTEDNFGGARQWENKKIDRCSLSFLLEGWEQDSTVKSQTQKSKKDLKLIDIIFDSSRVLSPHAQKYDRR